jgi:hypothetical protein
LHGLDGNGNPSLEVLMYFGIRTFLAGSTLACMAGLCGCDVYTREEPAPVAVESTYYDRGWYDGPYYYYEDRDGHRYHEMREEHERRERDRHVRFEGRHEEHEEHEHH